ncbi:MAG: hypothetical protein HKM06_09770, partial [Spirochaetales bacterium]|nr:hypothetical protein [Spirochaetales bacterium]
LQYVRVDAETGLLPSGEPGEHVIDEVFLTGTAPTKISNLEDFRKMRDRVLSRNIDKVVNNVTQKIDNSALDPTLNFDLNGTTTTPSTSPAPDSQSPPDSPLNPNLSN